MEEKSPAAFQNRWMSQSVQLGRKTRSRRIMQKFRCERHLFRHLTGIDIRGTGKTREKSSLLGRSGAFGFLNYSRKKAPKNFRLGGAFLALSNGVKRNSRCLSRVGKRAWPTACLQLTWTPCRGTCRPREPPKMDWDKCSRKIVFPRIFTRPAGRCWYRSRGGPGFLFRENRRWLGLPVVLLSSTATPVDKFSAWVIAGTLLQNCTSGLCFDVHWIIY